MSEDGDAEGVEIEFEDGEPAETDVDADEADASDGTETATDDPEATAADGESPDADEERDDLLARVEAADAEELADELAALRERVTTLEDERDDLEDRLKRKQAEFQNYKKRMDKRREQERERATEDLVERLLDVRDNLQRALDQEEGTDIRGGVETTLKQFDRVLDAENVEVIEPTPGEDVDPQRHEVLLRVESEEPAGSVADVHRPGYEMAGKVLRTAQVTVAEEDADAE